MRTKTTFIALFFIYITLSAEIHSSGNFLPNYNSYRLLQDAASRCGTSFEDANTNCGTECPSGTDAECPDGQTCFAGVPCVTDTSTGPVTAECGADKECPIKACCSKFGYCGWTEDFCNEDCQSNCELNPGPGACDDSQKMKKNVGYYESWAANRTCTSIQPSQINPALYTHLIFAFAYVSEDNKLVPAVDTDIDLYKDFTALKEINPNLKAMIAVGGWAFNDPPYQNRFTNMVSSQENRDTFINSAMDFMGQYGFDGVDIDWEYPGADDRGGKPEDFDNFVSLLKEMYSKFQEISSDAQKYELSITVPISNWYLQHFDLSRIPENVDFLNVMAYDIHGVWDASIESIGPYVRSHTNITEIEASLNMFFKNGVPSTKLVLGTGSYGRTWALKDPNCFQPGCEFTGPGTAGKCTQAAGTLAYFEIIDLLATNNEVKTVYDEASMSNYAYYGDQWISYDDSGTFSKRNAWASDRCLGGIMLWSVDMINTDPASIEANQQAFQQKLVETGGSSSGGSNSGASNVPTGSAQAKATLSAAQSCYAGFVKNIPPNFCYKKGGDAGVIPTDCPDGYFRNLALCYENCKDGYEFSGGVCWEKCKDGYASHPASCYKSLIPADWYFKKSYIPSSKTNFEATCPDGKYLSGALCYRDCKQVGLDNCGIGACAGSSGLCASGIAMIAVNFALGVAQAIIFVLSFGTSSGDSSAFASARKSISDMFGKLSKSDRQTAAQQAESAVEKMGEDSMKKKMLDYATKDLVPQQISNQIIKAVCDEIADQIIGDLKTHSKDTEFTLNFQDWTLQNTLGVNCTDTNSENGNIICAKSVLNLVQFVDPTGVVAMATAFLNPVCDVQ